MDFLVIGTLLLSTIFLSGLFTVPKAAILIRKYRPLASFLAIHAWLIVRCTKVQPSESLLELAALYLREARENVGLFLQEHHLQFAAPFVGWSWKLAEDLVGFLVFTSLVRIIYCLYHYSTTEWMDIAVKNVFEWAKENVPGVGAAIEEQTSSFQATADQVLNKDPKRVLCLELPKQGRKSDDILAELVSFATKEDKKWKDGKVSGTVYANSEKHTEFMAKVYKSYTWSNPLHPGVWPKLNQCEAEVISMTAALLHAPGNYGSMTSGGTESIILAIRAHLNHYGKRRGIVHPEIVCATSAHAAVNKACDMFGIRMVSIDTNGGPLHAFDVRRRVTSNTILIYASAPSYPQGIVDPIRELGQVAMDFDVGLHVDACLGGFILPFVDCEPFDFSCDGVTSMSIDTHKYGYANKGTSIVLYRSKELRHGQYFSYPHWTGGMYATPTIPGSRPGALAACAWATMVSIGYNGYEERAQRIVEAARSMAKGIRDIPGLKLLTPKPYMVVCFASDEVDIYRVQDAMTAMGWSLNELQSPASVHVCITLNVVPKVSVFLQNLRTAVAQVRQEGAKGAGKGTAGIYGVVGSLPEGPVECVLNAFTDMVLTP